MNKKNVVVFGASGMLASFLVNLLSEDGGFNVYAPNHSKCDITNLESLEKALRRMPFGRADYIVNCAAYTNVFKAEHEDFDKSYLINVIGADNIALAIHHGCFGQNVELIHISTDYVFSELCELNMGVVVKRKRGTCRFLDACGYAPVNAYGMHKLQAEEVLRKHLGDEFTIFRVGWLYGCAYGMHEDSNKEDFIPKVIKNAENSKIDFERSDSYRIDEDRPCIHMVTDGFSIPTSVKFVSECLAEYMRNSMCYEVVQCCPCGTPTGRFNCAEIIVDALKMGVNVKPINVFDQNDDVLFDTAQRNLSVRYPKNSTMQQIIPYKFDKTDWKTQLLEYLKLYKKS